MAKPMPAVDPVTRGEFIFKLRFIIRGPFLELRKD